MIELISILAIAFIQNVSFSMVSRARNRSSKVYHATCSVFSNGLWVLSLGLVGNAILINSNYWMAIPYIVGTVAGSLFGVESSIWIEKKIGAETN